MKQILALVALAGCTGSGGALLYQEPPSPTPSPTPTPRIEEPDDDAVFSPEGHTFVDPFRLDIESDPPGHPVLYTDDGTVPFLDSEPADGSILVARNSRYYAYVDYDFEVPEGEEDPGPDIGTHGYFRLGDDVADFESNLPLMLIHTFRSQAISANEYGWQPAHAMVMEPGDDGTTRILGEPAVDSPIGIQVRGSSTRNQPKHSYGFEFWDAHGNDDNIAVAGLAKESDWVLFAPLRFDQALIRNPIAYELSNRIGSWAPHTQQIELFMVENRAERFYADNYRGVYTLVEKPKRGVNRVDIDKLTPEDNAEPEITGGYIFKIDRTSEDDDGFTAGGTDRLNLVYPDVDVVTPAQMAYLIGYLDDMAAALNADDHLHPVTGLHYSEYLDVPAWIDHHIVNLFTKNPDGLRLSSYLHKPRGGKVKAGPVWDFDRTMGSRDGRDEDPTGWNPGNGNGYWTAHWWSRLMADPWYTDQYWARLEEVMATEFTPQKLSDLVDEMAAEVRPAALRNQARWPDYAHPNGYDAAVEHLRWWLTTRSEWISANIDQVR